MKKSFIVLIGIAIAIIAIASISSCESRSGKAHRTTIKVDTIAISSVYKEKSNSLYFSKTQTRGLATVVKKYSVHKQNVSFHGVDSLIVRRCYLVGTSTNYESLKK